MKRTRVRAGWAFAAMAVLWLLGTRAGNAAPVNGQNAAAKLARSSNAFGFDLYQRLRHKPGNLVISPASIATSLFLPWGGARGDTAAQMGKVLHLNGTASQVMATSGLLSRSLQDPARPIVFRIANQLFAEKTFQLLPAYLEKTKTAFGAPVESLDFEKAPDPSRIRINRWVESKTQGRIKDLIPAGGVAPDTRLVLVNAIYFLGDWETPFEHGLTRPAPFHLTAVVSKNVPTMFRLDEFRVARQDGVTALEIPYQGGSLSMMLLIPDEIGGLAAIESSLDARKLDALGSAMRREFVELALPKFKINPGKSLSLGEDLKALGMSLAFDRTQADFTGIADPPNPMDRLVLGKVFHKAFVRVDEKGTEAAAATEVDAIPLGGPPPQLRVDRPFLFLIRDTASGLILFLGRVSNPSRR